MKKLSLILAAAAVFVLGACSSKSSESQPQPESKNYSAILLAARSEEDNEYMSVIGKDSEGAYTLTHNPQEIDGAFIAESVDMTLEVMGLSKDEIEDLALSSSMVNVSAYCVAIVKPAAGAEEAVYSAMEKYWQLQQQSFEMYLADQYEITQNARLEKLDSGEIVFVMSADSDTVFDSIKTALAK